MRLRARLDVARQQDVVPRCETRSFVLSVTTYPRRAFVTRQKMPFSRVFCGPMNFKRSLSGIGLYHCFSGLQYQATVARCLRCLGAIYTISNAGPTVVAFSFHGELLNSSA